MSAPAPAMRRILAEGRLTWPPEERTLGRFGSVSLYQGQNRFSEFTAVPAWPMARMWVSVLDVYPAVLPPDPHRRLEPTVPEVGEEIELGMGHLFLPDLGLRGPIAVGLAPLAEYWRPDAWLSPTALYRAHNHHVRLLIAPARRYDTEANTPASA